jgi:hypothetical protein
MMPEMVSETPPCKVVNANGRWDMEQEIEDEKKQELESQPVYPDTFRKQKRNGRVSCAFFADTSKPTDAEMQLMRKKNWMWCSNLEGGSNRCHCDLCLILKSRTEYYNFPANFEPTARNKFIAYLMLFVTHVAILEYMYEIHAISNNGSNCYYRGKVGGIASLQKCFESHCINCKWVVGKIVTFCLNHKATTL